MKIRIDGILIISGVKEEGEIKLFTSLLGKEWVKRPSLKREEAERVLKHFVKNATSIIFCISPEGTPNIDNLPKLYGVPITVISQTGEIETDPGFAYLEAKQLFNAWGVNR